MAVINIIGFIVEIFLKIDPEFYGPFVTTDKKGENIIILQCINTIYRTMVDILLYNRKFVKTLKSNGFQINPYDPCVETLLVNDKHQTIFFHVKDCKLIHQDKKIND